MSDYVIDVVRELWNDKGDKIVTVKPDADGLNMVEISCESDRVVIPTEAIPRFVLMLNALVSDLEAQHGEAT